MFTFEIVSSIIILMLLLILIVVVFGDESIGLAAFTCFLIATFVMILSFSINKRSAEIERTSIVKYGYYINKEFVESVNGDVFYVSDKNDKAIYLFNKKTMVLIKIIK
jgi:hypothetical protein